MRVAASRLYRLVETRRAAVHSFVSRPITAANASTEAAAASAQMRVHSVFIGYIRAGFDSLRYPLHLEKK